MSIVLFVLMYALVLATLKPTSIFVQGLALAPGVELAVTLLLAILALFGPVLLFSLIDVHLVRKAIHKVASSRCQEQGATLLQTEIHKNHFAMIYQLAGRRERAKFRIQFFPTTWLIRSVQWL